MDDRPRTVGDGLTEKAMLYEDRDGDSPDWQDSTDMQSLDGLLKLVERECFAVLRLADLPQRYGGFAYHQSGRWMMAGDWAQARSLGTMSEPGWRLANIIWPIAQAAGHSHDSAVGFASRMLDDAVWIRRCDKKSDHERVAVFTFFLGVKRTEFRMKCAAEPDWLRGKKVRESAALTRKGDQAHRVAEVDRLAREIGRGGKTAAFRLVAEREGVTQKAIEADYYKAKKKVS
jgi:hypothetical protein